ncbi:hypothetical protein VOLCADRAFT_63657 [Volvox carteri f. nagariensis]|uniref:DNA-directed RNA polymerases I and III subunit RPAC2 n=1 Tax=Volvox carteri f. nagariensis TaxID=3068 RepID=D8U457_VOLCA|nr:uncharacterized protein VOLCADRAFT_63657 [Volvox carteri f. nagariensis]EFJ45440.1 hypothetical protein VOLCADRAFT_63657 [Volvox carteri f. nagariensis]|eukprot:XP_002953467.1 hypothetical protein VOLCADRAFT_63657 [Volvox carteri f. nagariensis]
MDSEATDFFAATFSIEEEDHTLANSLRFFLNKNPHVSFCGYSMPHPSEELVNLRVQTTGQITAMQAVKAACEDMQQVCDHMRSTLSKAVAEFQQQEQSREQKRG